MDYLSSLVTLLFVQFHLNIINTNYVFLMM